jgi:hypothetical protein
MERKTKHNEDLYDALEKLEEKIHEKLKKKEIEFVHIQKYEFTLKKVLNRTLSFAKLRESTMTNSELAEKTKKLNSFMFLMFEKNSPLLSPTCINCATCFYETIQFNISGILKVTVLEKFNF